MNISLHPPITQAVLVPFTCHSQHEAFLCSDSAIALNYNAPDRSRWFHTAEQLASFALIFGYSSYEKLAASWLLTHTPLHLGIEL